MQLSLIHISMIKILHTGDIHLGDLAGPTKDGANLRRQDTLRCMDAIVNKARTEGCLLYTSAERRECGVYFG